MKRARRHIQCFQDKVYKEVRLYKENNSSISGIEEDEREFMENWCKKRSIEEVALLLSLTYWMRTRSQVSVFFRLCDANKTLYMILCIHLSLKWLGDEYQRCRFINDLREFYPSMNAEKHQRMEMELLWALNWEMQ